MTMQQIQLGGYDTVVALTQDSINAMLAGYLDQMQKNVALYYTCDQEGNYVATTADEAWYTFTGTLDYTFMNGVPVDIVQLYTGQPQTILYNLTFSNAQFTSKAPPVGPISQTGNDPWIIQFSVDLALASVTLDSLPANVQQVVSQSVDNLGPDMFTIQQLYLDLNNAAFDNFQNKIEHMPAMAITLMSGIMKAYLAELQSNGGIIFGYVTQSTAASPSPPTFMPTALDFCVTPWTDPATGQHSSPGLDTLNYLVMTGNNPLPPDPPLGFGFNWVDDDTVQGTMAVRRGLIFDFLIPQLNPILQTISPTLHADADHAAITFGTSDSKPSFTIVDPPSASSESTAVAAEYSYSTSANDSDSGFGYSCSVSSDYSSGCTLTIALGTVQDTLELTGFVTCSASEEVDASNSDASTDMPATTYNWSVNLQLQMDLANNGSLDLVVIGSDFDSPPTVEGDGSSWLDTFTANMQQYVSDFSGLRAQVQTNLDAVLPEIKQALSSANHFVFPGANTFAFKNPQFSADFDLASNITYLS